MKKKITNKDRVKLSIGILLSFSIILIIYKLWQMIPVPLWAWDTPMIMWFMLIDIFWMVASAFMVWTIYSLAWILYKGEY